MRTRVKFPCVNEIEAMYERQRVNVNVERGSTLNSIRENNATEEIHLNTYSSHVQFIFKFFTT